MLGIVMLSVSCLAVFGASGAITADPGRASAAAPGRATPTRAVEALPPGEARRPPGGDTAGDAAERPADGRAGAEPLPAIKGGEPTREPTRPAAVGTVPPGTPRAGAESNIAQRLDREAVGGGLKLKALGAAKTTQGDRSVLAIYVRMENEGTTPIRIDPQQFKLTDRQGARFPISRAVEQMFPPVELGPRPAPGEPGKMTEGNLTFEIPRAAAGLALIYELPAGQPLRIPLPPEFG